jgi:prolipoprotein diacylglyceryltransferase
MFHDGFIGGMWYGWIFLLLVLIVIGWVIVKQMNKNKKITKEEFERIKKDLT